jgi:hypothetical protein
VAVIPTTAPVAPVISPAETCGSLPRDEALKAILVEVTDGALLDAPATPQGMAFQWLRDDDPLQIDPCTYATVEQRYALATLYYSTSGDTWDTNTGWLSGAAECTWFGVTCGGTEVTSLILGTFVGKDPKLNKWIPILTVCLRLWLFTEENQLEGEIPLEVRVFTSIETFRLGSNALEGPIPDILIEMRSLKIFDVEGNSMSGPAIVNLEGLDIESYRISENRFSGTINPSIGAVTSLKQLWMAENQLTGIIPVSLGNLVNLDSLYLYRNALEGTLADSLGSLDLMELQVHGNFLSGTIPESLYNNVNLSLLRVDSNQLAGTVSDSIGNLEGLGDFRVNDNLFSGTLPASFTNLKELGK